MTAHRTSEQREANDLDMEMDRMAKRLDAFADKGHMIKVANAARAIRVARGDVRAHMHILDVMATE